LNENDTGVALGNAPVPLLLAVKVHTPLAPAATLPALITHTAGVSVLKNTFFLDEELALIKKAGVPRGTLLGLTIDILLVFPKAVSFMELDDAPEPSAEMALILIS
jgi:hypothetical protein